MVCNRKAMSITLTGALLLSSFGVALAAPAQASVMAPMAVQTQFSLANQQLNEIQEFMTLINNYRGQRNLPPLKLNIQASQDATNWSKIMGNTGVMTHSSSNQQDASLVNHFVSGSRNENVAEAPATNVASMFNQWVASGAHNAAMISTDVDTFGFGIYKTTSNDPKSAKIKMYGTTVFYKAKDDNMPNTYVDVNDYKDTSSKAQPTVDTSLTSVIPASPTYNSTTRKVTIPSNTRGVRYLRAETAETLEAGKTYSLNLEREFVYAIPLEGYKISSHVTSKWNYISNIGKGREAVVANAPYMFVNGNGKDAISIEDSNYIDYYINGVKKSAGNYEYAKGTTVKTTAKIKDSYEDWMYLYRYDEGWDFLMGAKPVFGKPVIMNLKDNTYEIPNVSNVNYYVNNILAQPNTYSLEPGGVYNFTAKAASNNFVLQNAASFTTSYNRPDVKVTATAPTFNAQTKKYTIPESNGIMYKVDGVLQTKGTYSVVGNKNISVVATAAPGYILTGIYSWVGNFSRTYITPTAATFNDSDDTYTIPSVTGVSYYVNNVETVAGKHSATTKNITIEARSTNAASYVLSGTVKWSHVFEDVLTSVTPTAPTLNATTGTYVIPPKTGVIYYVDGVVKSAGTYSVAVGTTLSIVAEATSGYGLQGISSWTLSYTFTKVPVATISPSSVKSTGKYTLPNVTGVTWKVDGVTKNPGTYDSGWKKVTVTASAASANYTLTGTTSWTLDLTKTTVVAPSPVFSGTQYTIPNVAGVSYYVDSTFKKPGIYNSYNKLVAVHAAPSSTNYQLSGAALWTKDYRIAITPKVPTLNAAKTDVTIPVQANVIYYGPNGTLAQGKTYKFTGNVLIDVYPSNDSYKLTGTSKWTFAMKATVVSVTPTAPAANTSKKTITIPSKAGVTYYINGVKKGTGVHTYKNTGYIAVTAKANTNYKLTGTTSWNYVLTKISVKPTAPSSNTSKKTITIPSKAGVTYYINNVKKNAGNHTYKNTGFITVTAKATDARYALTGTQSWKIVLTKISVATPKPAWNGAKNTITIPSKAGVVYYVNNVKKNAGTETYKNTGYMTVTAKVVDARYALTGTQSWKFVLSTIAAKTAAPKANTSKKTITIPSKAGVTYYINGSLKKAGTYSHKTTKGYIKVTTKAANASYALSGTKSWSYVFNKISSKPTAPTFSTSKNTVKIPSKAGVNYYVNGSLKKAGTYKYKNATTLKVTTKATNASYALSGTKSWTKKI